jgi:hypothetical protein
MGKQGKDSLRSWTEKIGWKNRVKAVCKPCWELKYCPYGPLVEDFPLHEQRDERACRIFGHDCPVFSVAEPFTETRELRNVSRRIPRPMQFRVLKRDNQICAMCGRAVLDERIHFDHIIPWSKGGPTEEHNIRLLCDDCNRRKSDNFEGQHLVASFTEHVVEPHDVGFLKLLLPFVGDVHGWVAVHKTLPSGADVASIVGQPHTAFEDRMAETFADLNTVFTGRRATEIQPKEFRALKERWGFSKTRKVQKLSLVARRHAIELAALISAEAALMRRIGWPLKDAMSERAKWART